MPTLIQDDFTADSGLWLDGDLQPAAITVNSGRGVWTPTGTEALPDPGTEEWDSANTPTYWTPGIVGESVVAREDVDVHGGNYAARLDVDESGNACLIQQSLSIPVGSWVAASGWYKTSVPGKQVRLYISNAIATVDLTPGTAYEFHLATGRVSSSPQLFYFTRRGASTSNGCSFYGDDFSATVLAHNTLIRWQRIYYASEVRGKLWSSPHTQAGIIIGKDVNNYVLAYYNAAGQVMLIKRVGGVYSATLGAGAVTYTAGTELGVVPAKAFDQFSVEYGGTTVISDVPVADFADDVLSDGRLIEPYYAGFFRTHDSGVIDADAIDDFVAEAVE